MTATAYKKYLLFILLVLFTFNLTESGALGLVLQQIKIDLHLRDTELGLLTGIAFALFYSVMGIPIARWADGGNRVLIITTTTALWSVAVALCGVAASFLQLLLIRIGVAVGEAGLNPPAHSLIAESFTRAERPRAVAVYMLGGSLSNVTGYFMAGWLTEIYGWRLMFMLIGLPGLALAALVWGTLKEPRSRHPGTLAAPEPGSISSFQAPPKLREVYLLLWTSATGRHLLFSMCVVYFFGYGMVQWQPAFFIREFKMSTGELGTWFAAVYTVCGFLGTYSSGTLACRYAANNERLQLRVLAPLSASSGLVSAAMYLSPNKYSAFALMGVAAIIGSATAGPLFATIQTLVPPRMRATTIALFYLCANLIGLGLGPLVTGALSDAFRPLLADESLRFALLALCPGSLWGAWHLWQASKTVQEDLDAVHSHPDSAIDHRALLRSAD